MGTVKQATLAVGGLSNTSKMPCKSWGISAKQCKTGSKLAKIEGTICNGCYALKGAYVWPVVERAHARRLELINTSSWSDNMVTAINNAPFFRWFFAPPKGFKLTSTSHKHGDPIGQECIAYKQDNECRDCRACWDSEVQNISYKNH